MPSVLHDRINHCPEVLGFGVVGKVTSGADDVSAALACSLAQLSHVYPDLVGCAKNQHGVLNSSCYALITFQVLFGLKNVPLGVNVAQHSTFWHFTQMVPVRPPIAFKVCPDSMRISITFLNDGQ